MSQPDPSIVKLKNLGAASINILHAIGINSYDDLHEAGAVDTYCRIKARGIHVSKVMLYALQGALMDIHWNELTPELKAQLVKESDNRLKETTLHANSA